jgi:hypothetical protein
LSRGLNICNTHCVSFKREPTCLRLLR